MEGVWETRYAGLVFDYPRLCRLQAVHTVGVLLALAQLVMTIIVLNDMSRAFGKETGYTIGLVIFGFVFWTMLGFGASEPVDSDDD